MPLLLTWPVGKGRCTVFAGTPLGGERDDAAALWIADGWPALLGEVLAGE
jgi:hypothetical protein